MMTATAIVSLVALIGWLFLATRSNTLRRLPRQRILLYAGMWVAIFAVVAVVASRTP